MTLSPEELYRRGRAHLNAGRNASARRMLALADERTDDADLRARIAGSRAALVIRQGDPEEAERICREALSTPGLSVRTTAMLQGQLGLLALERGALHEAITLLDEGIAGVGDDQDHRPAMLINRSVARMQGGELAEAAADLELAATDYAAMGDDVQQAMAVHNAGYIALLGGDLIGALTSMARARAVMEKTSAVNVAICELDRAEVLRDAGMATDAERSLERVATVFGQHRMRQARGEAEFHRARSLLTRSPKRAAQVAAQAARTFRRVDSEWWALRADAVRLRALLDVNPDRGAEAPPRRPAAGDVERVASALEVRGLSADASSLRLSWELWRAGERHARGPRARSIRVPRDAPIQVRLLAHEVRAARAAAAGDGAAARRHAADGLDALSEWQGSFGSLDLASSLLLHGGGLIFTGLQAAVRSSRPEVVFDWSERARHLGLQSVPLRPPPDPELANDLAELRVARMESESGDWLAEPRAAALSERVRQRQWTEVAAGATHRRVDLAELQGALGDDTAYVTFVFDGSGMVALAVAGGSARVIHIEEWPAVEASLAGLRADLDMSAAVRSGPMARSVAGALEARLASISAALVDPLLGAVGDRRIVLTIAGVLGGIPWGMLPGLRGRVFTIATSASQWLQRRPIATGQRVGLAVGPGVARGSEEALRASASWPHAEILMGAAATVGAVTDLSARVDVLHVAAHGRHSRDHPLFSGLELADGTLFGYDIDLVPSVPDVVVMSACEVGRSTVRGGEEAIGMTRIWLHAGSSCVVAAPVVVADDIACELLGEMHAGLARGAAPAEALAAAGVEMGVVAPFQAYGAGF